MSQRTSDTPGMPIPAHHREWICRLLDAEHEHVVAARVGLSRLALVRAMAGLPVMRGTHAIIRIAYDQHKSAA
ncbi:MAG: hypothetical protein IPM35_20300 [Myxococcales bacterium]|nr:hypothetical protein [Myxococcales bacterium]